MKRSHSTSSTQHISNKKPHLEPWHRKPASVLDSTNDTLLFQQTSIEWSLDKDQKPVIRMYGTTEGGNSVLCRVHGFLPYAYFAAPAGFSAKHLPRFEESLRKNLGEDCAAVKTCEIVKRRSIYG